MKLTEFEKVASILAKTHSINVQEGRRWAANIVQRQVFYVKEDIYDLKEDHILGLTLHEIAHIHYTTPTLAHPTHPELFMTTLNVLEDISIEHIISYDYPNAGEILESTKIEVIDTLINKLPKIKTISPFEKALLYAAIRFEGRGYSTPVLDYEKVGEEVSKIMIQKKQEILNRKKTEDLKPIVEEIIALLIKELGEPTESDKDSMRGNDNNPFGSGNNGNQEKGTIQKEKLDGMKSGKGWLPGQNVYHKLEYVDSIIEQGKLIGKKIRTILKRNNAMEFGGRYRTGKLMTKRFVRIRAIKDRRPFARRIIKSNQSYAFALASDISGSMFDTGKKLNEGSYALSSMQMVGDALRYAGIPKAMIIFGQRAITVAEISKKEIRWQDISNYDSINKAGQGGTSIDEAIKNCTKELDKIRAERKIMIVLTDGQSDLTDMKKAHKEATNKGIECLGITLGEQDARNDYMTIVFGKQKNIIIKDTKNGKEVGEAFIKILKDSIQAYDKKG